MDEAPLPLFDEELPFPGRDDDRECDEEVLPEVEGA